jgi:hypothetical protein
MVWIQEIESNYTRQTRNRSVFQKGTRFTAIKLFKRLPKTSQSLKEDKISFRNKRTLYFMNNSFYTVSEFVEHNINN